LAEGIATVRPADTQIFDRRLLELNEFAAAIRARGGRVIVITLPTTGLVGEGDARRRGRREDVREHFRHLSKK